MAKKGEIKRKKIIVFAFEGKNNMTESNYFHHFISTSDDYIIKSFSCGCTDPKNMIDSTKKKRDRFDYNPKEDKTFIFIDEDSNTDKMNYIENRRNSLPKDISIIVSKPTFEIWFLNHFIKTTKCFKTNKLLDELKKYIPNYEKNKDIHPIIRDKLEDAINNSLKQLNIDYSSKTDVANLFIQNIIKDKEE